MNRYRKKVQESLERLNSYKPQEVVESIEPAINVNEPETVENVSKFVRTYEFNGRFRYYFFGDSY